MKALIILTLGLVAVEGALAWQRDRARDAQLARLTAEVGRLAARPVIDPVALAPLQCPVVTPARTTVGTPVPTQPAANVAAAVPPPSATQRAAAVYAHDLLDGALQRGRLDPESFDRLRSAIGQLDDDSAHEIRRSIAKAITQRQLMPDEQRIGIP